MDELLESLAGGFSVSTEPNCIAAPHPRFSLYKVKNSGSSQEERRRKYLELQKQKRFDFTNYIRCLADDVWDNIDDDEHSEDGEAMEIDVLKLKKPGRNYRNQLMLSEWMLEVPDNFAEDWVMVLCPIGKRSLVVATSGSTKSYARNGYCTNTFPSVLPGGSRRKGQSGYTVLDCIYCEAKRTYYVLDLMCWGHPVYDSETEFRFFWMQSKFEETPEAAEITRVNPYRFEALPNISCSLENIERVMASPIHFELDGLLFYHKKAHYTFGASPLVVWLKAYMLPEILGIRIPNELSAIAPSSYTDFGSHANAVRQRQQERLKKAQSCEGGSGNGSMDSELVDSSLTDVDAISVKVDLTSTETQQLE